MVQASSHPNAAAGEGYSCVDFGDSFRVSLMLVPGSRGSTKEQLQELLSAQIQILKHKTLPTVVTSQTIFLRTAGDLETCQRLLEEHYEEKMPATNFVFQPPCCGAALALEAWAIGGHGVRVEYCGPHTLAVEHDQARWTYCSGIRSHSSGRGAYEQASEAMNKMSAALRDAGSGFEQVVRTWFYLGGITDVETGAQRYQELNRARADFYRSIKFHCAPAQPHIPQGI